MFMKLLVKRLTLAVLIVLPGIAQEPFGPARGGTWKTLSLGNGLISLEIVPDIGGRITRFYLGGHQYMLVNSELESMTPPPSRVGPDGSWLNYGGDKLWVAPQGNKGPEFWPGPPDPVLDGGPYEARVVEEKDGKPTAVELRSGTTAASGVQLSRRVRIYEGTTRVSFEAEMRNVDTKARRWGIWAHTQLNGRDKSGTGHNPNLFAYCLLNPRSLHPKGYWVMYGPPDNPSFKPEPENGMMVVRYLRQVGKIGVDSDAGWIAVVDGTDGFVFVQRFTFLPGRPYPDNATVEFWADGYGQASPDAKPVLSPMEPGYGLESEIIGPFERLEPGRSATFRYDWYAANAGGNFRVWDCNDWAVTCGPMSAVVENGRIKLGGRFGLFYVGRIELMLKDKEGRVVSKSSRPVHVTPLVPLVLENTDLGAGVKADPLATAAVLVLSDEKGNVLGEVGHAMITGRQ